MKMEKFVDVSSGKRLFLLLLTVVDGIIALKDVSVVIPPAVRIMDTVTLQCDYDLEGEPLYTFKWYKGTKEFYRFIPKELPNTQVFPLPGINVDLTKSTPNKLVLKNVQAEATGRYKCEVSSDAPNFYTFMQSGYMYVIDVPVEEPTIIMEKDLLEIGQPAKGNCTAPASYPAANITWYLNGKRINESYLKHLPVMEQKGKMVPSSGRRLPLITLSGVEVEMDERIFHGGKARFSCVASIFELYNKEKEFTIEEDRPRPRPSSVLGNRDASAGSCLASTSTVICLVLLCLLNFMLR
ncbi:uncharacterized protein [Leptinotarsa decemlineata]|uniref:uncharacterized protein n=1 Tax=Leptinotarsa decemlineata TaxID=7539 RepID=UPI003D30417A